MRSPSGCEHLGLRLAGRGDQPGRSGKHIGRGDHGPAGNGEPSGKVEACRGDHSGVQGRRLLPPRQLLRAHSEPALDESGGSAHAPKRPPPRVSLGRPPRAVFQCIGQERGTDRRHQRNGAPVLPPSRSHPRRCRRAPGPDDAGAPPPIPRLRDRADPAAAAVIAPGARAGSPWRWRCGAGRRRRSAPATRRAVRRPPGRE